MLEVEGLSVRYPAAGPVLSRLAPARFPPVEVLSGIDIEIAAGRTLALLGESGSGKSTLARSLTGLVPLAAGTVRMDGYAPRHVHDRIWVAVRRQIGMIFQDPVGSLDPRMSLVQSVAEPLAIHAGTARSTRAERHASARQMLDRVGLPPRLGGRYPHEISGGQARRVVVARALVLGPKLVIADEPTAGLDISVQGEILNLLARVQREFNLAMLLITHNLAVGRVMSDEVAVLYSGRIVETGATADLYERPAHPYTAALLRPSAALAPAADAVAARTGGCGCPFHPLCRSARPRCTAERPALRATGPGRKAACHFPLTDADARVVG